MMKKNGGDEKETARTLRRSDRDSAGFIRSCFDVDWDDQSFYDLVINTQKLSAETGVRMILESVRSPEIQEGEKKTEERLAVRVADLTRAQRLEDTSGYFWDRHLNY